MTTQSMQDLEAPFTSSEIEWRVITEARSGEKARVAAYVTSRAIMNRLDSVFGMAWSTTLTEMPTGMHMRLCAKDPATGDAFMREDVAPLLPLEPTGPTKAAAWDMEYKGACSNALKRVGVQVGIGRYLYRLEESWVNLVAARPSGYLYSEWHYHRNKAQQTRYWKTPELPKWALPSGSGTETTQKPLPPMEESPEAVAFLDDLPTKNRDGSGKRIPVWKDQQEGCFAGIVVGSICWDVNCQNQWPCDDHPVCLCGSPMWDGRERKRGGMGQYPKKNEKAPDFSCKNNACKDGEYGEPRGIYWTGMWQKRCADKRQEAGLNAPI